VDAEGWLLGNLKYISLIGLGVGVFAWNSTGDFSGKDPEIQLVGNLPLKPLPAPPRLPQDYSSPFLSLLLLLIPSQFGPSLASQISLLG